MTQIKKRYLCTHCKERSVIIYSNREKSGWLCEKCYFKEEKSFGAKIKIDKDGDMELVYKNSDI